MISSVGINYLEANLEKFKIINSIICKKIISKVRKSKYMQYSLGIVIAGSLNEKHGVVKQNTEPWDKTKCLKYLTSHTDCFLSLCWQKTCSQSDWQVRFLSEFHEAAGCLFSWYYCCHYYQMDFSLLTRKMAFVFKNPLWLKVGSQEKNVLDGL